MIKLSKPYIRQAEITSVKKVLQSGWLAHGDMNKEFEKSFARYIGVRYAISLNSATSALFLALKAKKIEGSEVILPSFTFVASANSIVTAGAIPIFAEIDPQTFNIDPESIRKMITKRTRAIMVVHYAGQCCQMDKISALVRKHGLDLIEDSAETLGGKFNNKMAGSFGIGCFSFFPTKNITTGEGGMLTTNNKSLADTVRAYASHGIRTTTVSRSRTSKPWIRNANFAGYNFRLSNVLAAIGVEQLKRIDKLNALRRSHAQFLNNRLAELPEIKLPQEAKNCFHVYQMYVIKVLGKTINRDKFIFNLRNNGIGASVHFDPPVHLHEYYRRSFRFSSKFLKITERVASSIVTLPMYPGMSKRELLRVVNALKKALIYSRR